MKEQEKDTKEYQDNESLKQLIYNVVKDINDRELLNRVHRHAIYIKSKQ